MQRYTAVWDGDLRTPLNGSVVLSKARFACDWKSNDGSVVCFTTASDAGECYAGYVIDPTEMGGGTFANPTPYHECRVEFRRHRPTKAEPWIRMEYVRWESETEVEGDGELCDILLLPVRQPRGGEGEEGSATTTEGNSPAEASVRSQFTGACLVFSPRRGRPTVAQGGAKRNPGSKDEKSRSPGGATETSHGSVSGAFASQPVTPTPAPGPSSRRAS